MRLTAFCLLVLFMTAPLAAGPTSVELFPHSAGTYYVDVSVGSGPTTRYLVDTGASHVTVEQRNILTLLDKGEAVYIKDMSGILADGRRVQLPVYRVNSLRVGKRCHISQVEVVAVDDGTRCVLGLSALRKAAPLTLSVEPPQLHLSHCEHD